MLFRVYVWVFTNNKLNKNGGYDGCFCSFNIKTLNPDRTVVLETEDGKEIL